MVDSKRYDPTITRFQKHTKSFVSGKTKKGHLDDSDDDKKKGVIKEEGELVRVNSKNLHGKSWEVKVDGKTYMCTYGDNIIYLPPYTKNGSYYVPKKKCLVEVSIDKKSKIYTITRMIDPDKQPITMTDKGITLQSKGLASLTLTKDTAAIGGNELSVEGDLSVDGDIQIDTSKEKDLPDKISVTDLYKKVQNLEIKLSDKNDSGE